MKVFSSLIFSSSLLFVANALVVSSIGPGNNNDAFLASPVGPGGGIVSNRWSQLRPGGESAKNWEMQSLVSDTTHDETYTPSVFPKEDKERIFLEQTLRSSFLFQELTAENDNDLSQVIASFEKFKCDKGFLLCKQGDAEDTIYMYVIAKGKCIISIDEKKLPDPYGTIGSGSLVGDLALLYGTARKATVCAETPVTLYRFHRKDFNYFLDRFSDEEDGEFSLSSRKEGLKQRLKEIDDILDQISGVKSKYKGDIISKFEPSRGWLWRQWRGTILQRSWRSALVNMSVNVLFMIAISLGDKYNVFKVPITWPVGAIPDAEHPLIFRLKGFHKVWGYTMSITTLVLSFYLNKASLLWRDIYVKGRMIQGRLNDVSMVLACVAERDPKTGKFTDRASSLLEDVAVSSRLCHAFSWAGFIKRFRVILTPAGISRMLSRGIMKRSQYETLVRIRSDECGPQHTTLMWMLARIFQGMRDGVIPDDEATRSVLMGKICDMRATLGGVGDSLDGKIPLAYAHFVQVMVDVFLIMAPFALYSELGIWSIVAVGILHIFYSGMNDLSKILLDPLDNCNTAFNENSSVNMDVGVLIREGNAGSTRWTTGLQELPFEYSA